MIHYGSAYPDAVIDRLVSEVADTGLVAQFEPVRAPAGAADTGGLIAVEPSPCTAGVLLSDAMATAFTVLLDAAHRRRRRQQAAGEVRDVTVTLHLPDDVQIVVTTDASPQRTDLLMAAAARHLTAGTLTAGVWRWNPDSLRLQRALRDDPAPGA